MPNFIKPLQHKLKKISTLKVALACSFSLTFLDANAHAQSFMDNLRDLVENGESMMNESPQLLSDPSEVKRLFNSVNWDDGKKRVFSNLRRCYKLRQSPVWYGCEYAYVKIYDPIRGNRLCELNKDALNGWALAYVYNRYNTGSIAACKPI